MFLKVSKYSITYKNIEYVVIYNDKIIDEDYLSTDNIKSTIINLQQHLDYVYHYESLFYELNRNGFVDLEGLISIIILHSKYNDYKPYIRHKRKNAKVLREYNIDNILT